MKQRNLYRILVVLSILVLAPTASYTQTKRTSGAALELGAGLESISPVGDFRRNVGGWSVYRNSTINFNLILPVSRSGIFRLRFDCFILGRYKKSSMPQHLYDLGMNSFSLGPELGLPYGPVQPYVNVEYGWSFLRAVGYIYDDVTKQINNQTHGAGGWIFGSGFRIPLGSRKRWAVDIGARYYRFGESSYLSDGGIHRNSDGFYEIVPTRGETPFIMFTLGFQYRIFAKK